MKFTPMTRRGHLVYLADFQGGFSLFGCPEPEALAELIVTACNAAPSPEDKIDAARYRAWRDATVGMSVEFVEFVEAVAEALPDREDGQAVPTAAEWDAAIDAAAGKWPR